MLSDEDLCLHVDDRYNKLRKNIGNDFSKVRKVKELYSFQCGNCGYRNIHDVNEMVCGCGRPLKGLLVYRKVDDMVIYDTRENRRGKG
jgi:hypothetical protein